jgi:CheY-like chemotaxis protein
MTKVLIIEDDPWLADVLSVVLKEAGFSIRTAQHGPEAMDMIDSLTPNVIISDVLLAGGTSFTLLHELQSHSDTKMIPIILCSNLAGQLDTEQLKAYGVRRVIDKTTMHPSDVVTAVRAVIA